MSHRPTRDELAGRLEDVRWMAETGECLDGAARRLGLTRNTLEKWLARSDADALRLLVSRQPRDHNRFVAEVSIYELTGRVDRRPSRLARRAREGVAA